MNTKLHQLLEQFAKNPRDDKTLGQLGVYYRNNPDGDKDLYYFKKAYDIHPNVKNTVNYAYCLFDDYGDLEKALDIIKGALSLQVNHFYAYALYAQLLFILENPKRLEHYQKIIDAYHQALKLFIQLSQKEQSDKCDKKLFIKNNLAIRPLAKLNHPIHNPSN